MSEETHFPHAHPDVSPQPTLLVRLAGSTDGGRLLNKEQLRTEILAPGRYEVWRFAGFYDAEMVPERVRAKFTSAVRRPRSTGDGAPRKPRVRKPK